jgi:DNA polymerase I-like protein with 3'-5' exonuclease and polymerase domains
MRFVVDLESNGLLHEMDRVHCIVLRDIDTGEVHSHADQDGYKPIQQALDLLLTAKQIVGHNIISFDIRALKKIYPEFHSLFANSECDIVDTLVMSRVLWPELEPVDEQRFAHIDKKYKGRHSLAAWGERLGVEKIKFKEETKKDLDVVNVWEKWTPSMQIYCEGDTLVSLELYNYFLTQFLDPRCHELEHEFAKVMAKQEEFGFPFNERAAYALVNTLKTRRSEIDDELQQVFPPLVEERVSEKTGRKLKSKVVVFNPGSRQQTADRLRERYPEITFGTTEKGNVKVDDDVLELLGETYPEAKLLAEYQLVNKRLGQISEGKEALLKHCQKYGDSRIHGGVKTNACVSGRCSHVSPNMSQVPTIGAIYGAECRALFTAPEGWVLVGTDASALELRALGAWLAHFDGGEYAKLVSTEGFDIHSYNAQLFGIWDGKGEIEKSQRNLSKSCIFAVCYGAGARKVGSLFYPKASEHQMMAKGKDVIDTFYQRLPAIKKLKDKIAERINSRGYLTGIDGRHLQIRSAHSALNQLLQSTGAVLMKKATCILYENLTVQGLVHHQDYGFCGFFHDEWQLAVKPEYVDILQPTSINAIKKSGEFFKLLCPFTGESRTGKNWFMTH